MDLVSMRFDMLAEFFVTLQTNTNRTCLFLIEFRKERSMMLLHKGIQTFVRSCMSSMHNELTFYYLAHLSKEFAHEIQSIRAGQVSSICQQKGPRATK